MNVRKRITAITAATALTGLAVAGLTVPARAAHRPHPGRTATSTAVTSPTVLLSGGLKLVPAGAGYNYIVNEHSGKCLTVDGYSSSNGAAVNQYTCVGQYNQQWIASTSKTGFQLQARHSGRCMSVKGGSKRKGAPVIQWNCNGSLDQAFIGANKRLIPQHSRECLSIQGGSTANRAPLVQWSCNGASDQNFLPRHA
ncbi:RICIN domain-containing protein [Streptomyces sp. NPDC020883]|uniref:RICIN domain-containing protein n=1 Tax=Streptomyces sp. NPDC020883 TaxID=3365099 RepID=UPI0037A3ACF0